MNYIQYILSYYIRFLFHYWIFQNNNSLYTISKLYNYISINAIGSLVKKLKLPNGELSSHIYLYQIVCEIPTVKMPVFQMLSAVQHTNAILYWKYIESLVCTKQIFSFEAIQSSIQFLVSSYDVKCCSDRRHRLEQVVIEGAMSGEYGGWDRTSHLSVSKY